MINCQVAVRRKFQSTWDEINYVHDKLLYWLYERGDRRHAQRFADRLEHLCDQADPDQEAIMAAEARALAAEVRKDWCQAIRHREKEIELIRKLWAISLGVPGKDYPLREYGPGDLSDRLDLLATLYHDAGQLNRAVESLRESKHLCAEYGVPFEGENLLHDYLQDQSDTIKVFSKDGKVIERLSSSKRYA